MKILSLFDGISCARVALERVGIPVEVYFASEVDKYAVQISKKNYPYNINVGDVKSIKSRFFRLEGIDLLIGGSPCQDLSIAKRNRKGLDGERSGLFWEYVRILKEVRPKYFILENVASMPKEAKDIITKELGVEPVMFNASLVSAQMRKRLFWTNIKFTLPEDKGILLKDILIDGIETKEKSLCITATYSRACPRDYFGKSSRQLIKVGHFNKGGQGDRVYSVEGKSVTLSALGGGRGAKTGLYMVALTETRTEEAKKIRSEHMKKTGKDFSPRRAKELVPRKDGKMNTITTAPTKESIVTNGEIYRKLHPIECERLQGLPEVEKSCIIRICLDHQKNLVNVGDKNLKLPKCVGSAEKIESKVHVLSVEKNLSINHQQTDDVVQSDVLINCEEDKIEIFIQGKLVANVSCVELKNNAPHLKSIGDFVHLIVGLNTIVERTMLFGKEELLQKSNLSVVKKNGNNVVNIYGKGITQLVEDAKKDLTTLNKLLKPTISDLSIQESKEQTIQTLFSYVVHAILGYIPKEIQNQNTLTFQIKSKTGYTFGVSNTQRYKACGNAFNVDVVAHILSFIPR